MTSGTAAPSPPEQQHTRHTGTGHQAPGTPGGKPARAGSTQTGGAAYYSQIHKNRDTTTQHTQKQSLTKGAGGMIPGAERGRVAGMASSVAAISREIRHCKNASADSSPLIINELRFFLGSDFQSKINIKRLFLRKMAVLHWVGIKIPYRF